MKHSSSSRRGRSRGNGKRHPSQKNNFESNGPDVKIRGTAQQVLEKYLALGRDATSGGDRINAEAYFQHAEHYYRLINNAEAQNQNRQPRGRGTPQNGGQPAETHNEGEDGENAPAAEAAAESVDAMPPQAAPAQTSSESADDESASEKADGETQQESKPRAPRRRGPGRPRRPKSDTGGEPPKEPASA